MKPMNIQIPDPLNYMSRKDILPQIMTLPTGSELTLNFNGVTTIDSSGLGILLLAREKVKGSSSKKVSLVNCNDQIKKIFEIAQFHILFKIT